MKHDRQNRLRCYLHEEIDVDLIKMVKRVEKFNDNALKFGYKIISDDVVIYAIKPKDINTIGMYSKALDYYLRHESDWIFDLSTLKGFKKYVRMARGTIYLITNLDIGYVYVGETNSVYRRRGEHLGHLKKNYYDRRININLLKVAWKYGVENLSFHLLEYCDISEAREFEHKHILKFKDVVGKEFVCNLPNRDFKY